MRSTSPSTARRIGRPASSFAAHIRGRFRTSHRRVLRFGPRSIADASLLSAAHPGFFVPRASRRRPLPGTVDGTLETCPPNRAMSLSANIGKCVVVFNSHHWQVVGVLVLVPGVFNGTPSPLITEQGHSGFASRRPASTARCIHSHSAVLRFIEFARGERACEARPFFVYSADDPVIHGHPLDA